jgi:hypothetical protein
LKLSVVKPKDWEQKLGRLLDHHLATVHEVAMDAVPAPWPTLFMPQLREGLSDMCSRVRWIACCRAGETGDRSLIPLLQAQVADEFCGSFAAASIAQLNKSK